MDEVLSDLHVACQQGDVSTLCSWIDATDDDGDLILPRRQTAHDDVVHELTIRHAGSATPLGLVGMQLWRGAVAMCDYLWAHRGRLLRDRVLVELGAGCGLVSLLAARGGACVLLTDAPPAVLDNAAHNMMEADEATRGRVRVRRLDWAEPITRLLPEPPRASAFEWSEADAQLLWTSDLVLCADCVYDVAATEMLLRTVRDLLEALSAASAARGGRAAPVALVTLERRLNFALPTLCAADASAYARFRELLLPADAGVVGADGRAWQREGGALVGEQLDLSAVPRSMRGEAGEAAALHTTAAKQVELWRLRVVRRPLLPGEPDV